MRTIPWITASLGAARLGRRRAEGRLAGLFRTFHPLAFPSLLERLAIMTRGADTARLDLSPAAPGLLAASLGLSRIYDDDLEQLNAGVLLYDAFYRWCRDATKETNNRPTNKMKP